MRGQISITAVAYLAASVFGAVVPTTGIRAGSDAAVPESRISVPPWFLSLASEYVI
jgi:hypothetical protein